MHSKVSETGGGTMDPPLINDAWLLMEPDSNDATVVEAGANDAEVVEADALLEAEATGATENIEKQSNKTAVSETGSNDLGSEFDKNGSAVVADANGSTVGAHAYCAGVEADAYCAAVEADANSAVVMTDAGDSTVETDASSTAEKAEAKNVEAATISAVVAHEARADSPSVLNTVQADGEVPSCSYTYNERYVGNEDVELDFTSKGDPWLASTLKGSPEEASTSKGSPGEASTSKGDSWWASTSKGDPWWASPSKNSPKEASTSKGDPCLASTSKGSPGASLPKSSPSNGQDSSRRDRQPASPPVNDSIGEKRWEHEEEKEPTCCGSLLGSVAEKTGFRWIAAMRNYLEGFDKFLTKSFHKLGYTIATHTGYFIIVPLLLTVICTTGFQRIKYEDDPEYLFAPTNGAARSERAVIEENFHINYTWDFHPARMTRNGRFARFIIVAKDNGSLLRTELWDEIMKVDSLVHNISITEENRDFFYKDLCAIWGEKCWGNQILDIGELIPEINNNTFNLTYPFMLNPRTFESYVFPFHFGGIETTNYSTIHSVKALTLYYWLRTQNQREDNLGYLWEQQLLKTFLPLETNHTIVTFFTSRTLENELENNTNSVIPYFGVTVAIMLIFCLLTVTMGDCVRSKTLLGLIGVLCAGLSCLAAFGFLIYIGVPFIGINMAAPFLMLGIGIDDTFVMLAAWRRSSLQDSVPDRLANTFADAAVSITITSITDMISFYVGATTPFPSVQIFCLYTGTAVLMTYLWHITLFGACLAVSGYLEQSNRHNVTCMKVKPYSDSKDDGCGYRVCCAGGINKENPWLPEDNQRHAIMVFFRDYVATFLNIPAIKAFVVMVFLIYLGVAMWGCTMVNEGLERRKLSRYDSYSVKYYDLEDQYFRSFPYRVQVAITGDLNYSDPATQDKVLGFLEKIESHKNIGDPLYTVSWLRSWKAFMARNGVYLGLNNTDELSFIENLKEYYLSGSANVYALDVSFNEEGTRIVASRFVVQAYEVADAVEDRELMTDLRRIAAESGLNATIYHPFFIFFDQFTLVRSTSIQTISYAAAIMMVVSLIFIPNPLCSLWVAFSIVSIEVGVVGYMTLWGVNLDSISMIQLIMCIGFSVDFSAHISYAYLAAKVDTPDERVRECLYALGLPIVQGGLSTILGIMALVLAPSYIFVTFFRTVFLVIFFGAVHGLFLLPVLLSLLGPGSFTKKKKPIPPVTAHPMYADNNGVPLQRNGGLLALNGAVPMPGQPIPPHMIIPKDKTMQIPRPKSLGPAPNHKVNANGPPTYKCNPFNEASGAAVGAKEDNGSIERDLGLGTSGEESSESSLRQGGRRKANNEMPLTSDNRKRRDPAQEVYTNRGYISDELEVEERRARERQVEYFGEWEDLQPQHTQRPTRWQSARYTPTEPRGQRHYRSDNSHHRGEPYSSSNGGFGNFHQRGAEQGLPHTSGGASNSNNKPSKYQHRQQRNSSAGDHPKSRSRDRQ